MTGICPCCGGDLQIGQDIAFRHESHTLVSSDFSIQFSKYEADVFDVLWRNRNTGRVSTKDALFDHLYALDPMGGPDPKVIEVMICKIRKKLEGTGIEIATVHNRGYFLRSEPEKPRPSRKQQPQEYVA